MTEHTLYINSNNIAEVKNRYKKLSGLQNEMESLIPSYNEMLELLVKNKTDCPTIVYLAKTHKNWIVIKSNYCGSPFTWIESISKALNCKVIDYYGSDVSEAYTLIVADEGEIIRAIQVCHNDKKHKSINEGDKYKFEKEIGFSISTFNFELIDSFCEKLGLEDKNLLKKISWFKLSS